MPMPAVSTLPVQRNTDTASRRVARVVYDVLNPIPYGCFIAALIFDVVYDRSAEVLWFKSAAWLIVLGLLFAVLPRLINLAHVWFPRVGPRDAGELAGFWLNLLAIVAAIANAFAHSRDAYGVMPDGLWLSLLTTVLLVLARAVQALRPSARKALS